MARGVRTPLTKPRIAFVVQRAGLEVNGGAEAVCLSVARSLASVWDVDIITTTARDYTTWASTYPAGAEQFDGVTIRRFAVDAPREPAAFDRLSRTFRRRLRTAPMAEQEAWMKAQGPYSTALLHYIAEHRDDYELFFFYTYLYATTYFGLPLVAEKAWLVPFAHDEWMLGAALWDSFFTRPAGLVFSTPEERELVARRFPGAATAGPVIGSGVTMPDVTDPARFRRAYGITEPYVLYLGRIDPSKGIDELLAAFGAYKRDRNDDLSLVLVGRAETPIDERPSVRALGFVDERDKIDALAGAEVVIMPSRFESLSIAVLEAWSVGKPVLVTAKSRVLVAQARRAQGGLWYANAAEFAAALDILRGPAGRRLGACGYAFVKQAYDWPRIVAAYERIRRTFVGEPRGGGEENRTPNPLQAKQNEHKKRADEEAP